MTPTTNRKILELFCSASKIYRTTVAMFYCTLCVSIAEQYAVVKHGLNSLKDLPIAEAATEIKHLRLRYSLLFKAVCKLEECFGIFMLIFIPCSFITVINAAVCFVTSIKIANWAYTLLNFSNLTNHAINVFIISYSTDLLLTKVGILNNVS